MAKLSDVKTLLYGVQFNHSFKLLDHWGEIADEILYHSSQFGSEFFSNISSQYTTERSLSNPITGNTLILAPHMLVFKYYVPEGKGFKSEYDLFCARCKYLVEEILSKYNQDGRQRRSVTAKNL